MTDLPLVTHPDQASPAWLTDVLRASGHLPSGSVVSVDVEPVGTGQVGDSYRLTLDYEGGEGPTSIVGKFPCEDETSRQTATSTRTYEIESRFYQQLRSRVDIRTPAPFLSLFDETSHDFALLLEDMAPATQGDQIAGCDADTAAIAVDQIARLHAPVWGDPSLEGLDWLNRATPESHEFGVMLFSGVWPGFLERYEHRLDDGVAEAGAQVIANIATFLTDRTAPFTAAHGDYRLDNMLFGDDVPLCTVDWQTVQLGPGVSDVSYFMGTSPTADVRAADEQSLVRHYHDTLVGLGVTGYDFDRCFADYRRYAFAGFLMAVVASMLVGRTDRGDEMFMCMANRSGRMGIELETLNLVTG